MPNVRPLNRKKYNISKRAFQTAYNYCLQYTEERGAGRKERHKSRTESDWTAGIT